jgi:hypothetical protein
LIVRYFYQTVKTSLNRGVTISKQKGT